MKILVRNSREGRWRKMDKEGYSNEAELQQLLMDSPHLIPMEDITGSQAQVPVFIPEFGLPGSGASDLIGVDESGNITVVECKLAANSEVKRKVVGQVLEYAAFLWQMSYEEFDRRVVRRMGQRLTDLVVASVSSIEWSEEEFQRQISETLAAGDFSLIIAVDALNDELRRTIEYLNSRGPSSVKLYALEAQYFADKGLEILVPHVYGAERPPPPPPPEWYEDRFFEEASDQAPPAVIPLIRELYTFITSEAESWRWGTGRKYGNVLWRATAGATQFTVFNVSTMGGLGFSFPSYPKALTESQREGLRERLNQISGLNIDADQMRSRYPTFSLAEAFTDQEDLGLFKDAIRWFMSELKGKTGSI